MRCISVCFCQLVSRIRNSKSTMSELRGAANGLLSNKGKAALTNITAQHVAIGAATAATGTTVAILSSHRKP